MERIEKMNEEERRKKVYVENLLTIIYNSKVSRERVENELSIKIDLTFI
jgi:hypothetical protein